VFGTQNTAVGLLLGLLVYPLLEEWVFRAGILQWLDTRWLAMRGWRTNALVSGLFAAAHLWAWPLGHAVAVFVPSLLFGWVWQRWQKLWLCTIVHAACNAAGYAIGAYSPGLLP
jgi:uncharacterized protein